MVVSGTAIIIIARHQAGTMTIYRQSVKIGPFHGRGVKKKKKKGNKLGLKCDLAVGVIFLFGLQIVVGSIIYLSTCTVTSTSTSLARLCLLYRKHIYRFIVSAMYI